MILDAQEAERIARYLALHAPPQRADLAFVFGTRRLAPIDLAADLFHRGLVCHVVLTGGSRRDLGGLIEALTHQEVLLDRGVPEDRIILESESTNTLENVVFALPKVAARIDIGSIGAVTVVAKWYHARRCVMTLKPHLPQGVRYYVASYEPAGRTRADWRLTETGTAKVLEEWQAIPKYLQKGDLAEVREEDGAYV